MRKGLILVSLLLLALNIANGEKIEKPLDTSEFYSQLKNISSSKTLEAEFHQTNIIKDFGEDNYKGTIYINYGKALFIEYMEPTYQYYLIKDRVLTYYDKATNQATIGKLSNSQNDIDIFSLLYDLRIIEEQLYVKSYINSTALLAPKNKEIPVETVEIVFLNESIKKIKVIDSSENQVEIEFSKLQKGVAIPEAVYEKQPPKGASIIKMGE